MAEGVGKSETNLLDGSMASSATCSGDSGPLTTNSPAQKVSVLPKELLDESAGDEQGDKPGNVIKEIIVDEEKAVQEKGVTNDDLMILKPLKPMEARVVAEQVLMDLEDTFASAFSARTGMPFEDYWAMYGSEMESNSEY